MQPIIVGIDPGTTAAFAALSFDLEVLEVKSRRNYSLNDMIADVYTCGNPIIVGTDKKDVPSFIKEFSQKTGARIHTTSYDTKKGEKKTVVRDKGFDELVTNAHETDALASAIYAYHEFLPLINRIHKFVQRHNKKPIQDDIFLKVISDEMSVKQAAKVLERVPEKPRQPEPKKVIEHKQPTPEQREIKLLRSAVRKLKKKAAKYKKSYIKVKDRKVDIDKETKKIISFKEKRALHLEEENKILRQHIKERVIEIDRLNAFISCLPNIIKKLDNLSSTHYQRRKEELGIEENDVLLVKDITVASKDVLKNMKHPIIYEKGPNKDIKSLLIPKDRLDIMETDLYAYAPNLKDELKRAQAKDQDILKDILEQYKRERLKDIV